MSYILWIRTVIDLILVLYIINIYIFIAITAHVIKTFLKGKKLLQVVYQKAVLVIFCFESRMIV